MTLPIPPKEDLNSLYMTWLEAFTVNMPPFLLVRGNQTSVLTFKIQIKDHASCLIAKMMWQYDSIP